MGYLDTVAEGVEVSRQDLGSGQYRWTITFLDEGDDFDLAAESPTYLSISPITATSPSDADPTGLTVTTTKVRLGETTNRYYGPMMANILQAVLCGSCHAMSGLTPATQNKREESTTDEVQAGCCCVGSASQSLQFLTNPELRPAFHTRSRAHRGDVRRSDALTF